MMVKPEFNPGLFNTIYHMAYFNTICVLVKLHGSYLRYSYTGIADNVTYMRQARSQVNDGTKSKP